MKKYFLILYAVFAFCLTAGAQQFEARVYHAPSGDSLLYRELDPVFSAVKGGKYPLVLFLHGAGERGDDNTRQLFHGSKQFLKEANARKYPAYVLFPQCPKGRTWAYDNAPAWKTVPSTLPVEYPESTMSALVMGMLESFIASHPDVDVRRIYVMGLSMGGFGTYDIVTRYPRFFAAAVPICGSVNPEKMSAARKVKFSIYHGSDDPTVPVEGSRGAYEALRKARAKVRYKEFEGVGHGCWNLAFNEPDFLEWLFSQHR